MRDTRSLPNARLPVGWKESMPGAEWPRLHQGQRATVSYHTFFASCSLSSPPFTFICLWPFLLAYIFSLGGFFSFPAADFAWYLVCMHPVRFVSPSSWLPETFGRDFHAILGWKALMDSIDAFGAQNPLTALVPKLEGCCN